ncbi:hypothetical protein JCGZ_23429 [Jatropha curcas]|uniref:MSP domain-containing protein n=1 Tax=Jatropha curcas TaxID=180498 RepID=A0A067JI21_JATCU|nr:vesicle-associated protein 1-1 [Jatropha curcas]XP_012089165.1 vesicle-associated protein 1-1 [Jatropha curcas]XP_012089166.1 vesicle-associated protein 1-1 [Jatropha curcas]XP_020540480.1 vesicle-associated protein 1-1 [Jatropha curcas]KDP23596.1 hypothetical protein JCGZ_23429 [Jatropha curcas]
MPEKIGSEQWEKRVMSTQLLEVQPRELKFIFELKKQSSCVVRLTNNSHNNVAFKVKTTSPKKYCVRPNVGVVLAKSTCEFTVTMQAPKVASVDMICKDKFLIQSTVVPLETSDEDITPDMFTKNGTKYIEEIKLRVTLISPPQSPVLSPINGVLKQEPFFEGPLLRDRVLSTVDNTPPPHKVSKNVEFKMTYDQESKTEEDGELKPKKDVIDVKESKPANNAELMQNNNLVKVVEVNLAKDEQLKPENDAINDKTAKNEELKPENDAINDKKGMDAEFHPPNNALKDAEFVAVKGEKELKLINDVEEMKSKLNVLELKLNEAESTIFKLTEEKRLSIKERKNLQEELALLRSRTNAKNAQVGFPLLFVVMVGLISILLGYVSHP